METQLRARTTNINLVQLEPVKADWHNTNAERIGKILAMIPPRENTRPESYFYEYRVMDPSLPIVLIVEWYQDDYTAEQTPEGIRYFTPGFTCGFITPDGDLCNSAIGSRWRASLVCLHGEPKITILSMGDGHFDQPLSTREHWASMVSYIQDEHIRHGMIQRLLNDPPGERPTPLDFLKAAHDVHRNSFRHSRSFIEPSVVTLF